MPERDGAFDLSSGIWKLGRHTEDRQTDMWAPVEVEGSFDNAQILAFWMQGLSRDPETPERMAEIADSAVEFFAPLVDEQLTAAQRAELNGAAETCGVEIGALLEHYIRSA